MKSLYNYILEAKDDNLHEFIQYLNDCGKEGELKSSNSIYKFIEKSIDGEIPPKYYSLMIEQYRDEYCEQRGIEDIEEIDDTDFGYWCQDKAIDIIQGLIETNNNNCIYIERVITLPKFSDKTKLYKEFKKTYSGHLGIYWTYLENAGQAYWGNSSSHNNIILKGYVRPEDVNWNETVNVQLATGMEEYELNLYEDSPIQLTEITTSKGKHKIFKGNLILQA